MTPPVRMSLDPQRDVPGEYSGANYTRSRFHKLPPGELPKKLKPRSRADARGLTSNKGGEKKESEQLVTKIGVAFDYGRQKRGNDSASVKTQKVWGAAREVIRAVLTAAPGCPPGQYQLRPEKQIRWQGQPRPPWKVTGVTMSGGSVRVAIKPDGGGSDSPWEYHLRPPVGVAADDLLGALKDHRDGPQKSTGPAQTAEPAPPMKLAPVPADAGKTVANVKTKTIKQRIEALEARVAQGDVRKAELRRLEDEERELTLQLTGLQTKLDKNAELQLQLIEDYEEDEELTKAREKLARLEELLGD